MRNTLECLWQLQEFDRKILALRGGVLVPHLRGKQDELRRIKLRIQEKQQGRDDLRLNINQTKAALESSRQRIVEAKTAVKKIKSSDVLQATMKELEHLKKREEELELKDTSLTKEFESLNTQIADLENMRIVAETDLADSSAVQGAKVHEIAAGVQEIEALKAPLRSQIPSKYLVLYQRIVEARGGIGAARIQGASCGGCNMLLPAQFVSELFRANAIEQCPSCKRILIPQPHSIAKAQ